MQAASFAVSLLTLRRQVHFAGRVFMRGRLNDGTFLKYQGRQQLCKQISWLIVLQRQVYSSGRVYMRERLNDKT